MSEKTVAVEHQGDPLGLSTRRRAVGRHIIQRYVRHARRAQHMGELLWCAFGYGIDRYSSKEVTDESGITAHRTLFTKVMLRHGQLTPEDIEPTTGLAKLDEYDTEQKCLYFSAFDSRRVDHTPVAGVRLLWDKGMEIDGLRLNLNEIDPDLLKTLEALEPGKVAEIGGFVKKDDDDDGTTSTIATLVALRAVRVFANKKGIEYLIAGLEPKVAPSFLDVFARAGVRSLRSVANPRDIEQSLINPPGAHGPKAGLLIKVSDLNDFLDGRSPSCYESNRSRSLRKVIGGSALRRCFNK